jgi:hypothetical protein
MNSDERLDQAINKLREMGHKVGDLAVNAMGETMVLVDGTYRTRREVFELAAGSSSA